jgi:hypothetical protein
MDFQRNNIKIYDKGKINIEIKLYYSTGTSTFERTACTVSEYVLVQ